LEVGSEAAIDPASGGRMQFASNNSQINHDVEEASLHFYRYVVIRHKINAVEARSVVNHGLSSQQLRTIRIASRAHLERQNSRKMQPRRRSYNSMYGSLFTIMLVASSISFRMKTYA
jgi:hypothetical protein